MKCAHTKKKSRSIQKLSNYNTLLEVKAFKRHPIKLKQRSI